MYVLRQTATGRCALSRIAAFAATGDAFGWLLNQAAATPETTAVDSLVPDPRNRPFTPHAVGWLVAIAAVGGIAP